MAQPRRNPDRRRRLWAALLLAAPVLLAGCTNDSPAYVIDANHAHYEYAGYRPYTEGYPAQKITVREGDNLSFIAERCDTSTDELVRLNDLGDDHTIYPGEELRVPSRVCEKWADVPRPKPRPRYRYDASYVPRPEHRPDRYDSDSSEEAKNDSSGSWWWSWWYGQQNTDQKDYGSAKFIWPVRGSIIEGFGHGRHGERNDGINIASEDGTPIRAAASGVVTYTGNELKGYGNLVLIRHDGGYVTAYAHAASVRVERGEHVEKGQVIATVGETGDVERPQLHFEIRKGTEAVDPQRYLADRAS